MLQNVNSLTNPPLAAQERMAVGQPFTLRTPHTDIVVTATSNKFQNSNDYEQRDQQRERENTTRRLIKLRGSRNAV